MLALNTIFFFNQMMTLEDVEKIMEETQEAVEYQQVSSIVL